MFKRHIAFDFESYMGEGAPSGKTTYRRLPFAVCMTWQGKDDPEPKISTDFDLILETARHWLTDPDTLLLGIEAAFDVGQIVQLASEMWGEDWAALVHRAYDEGRIIDLKLRCKLNDIENTGLKGEGYSLKALAKRHLGIEVEGKKDASAWRYRYAELDGLWHTRWPYAAREYALEDARITIRLDGVTEPHGNESFQSACAWALACTGSRGLRVDLDYTQEMMDFYEGIFHYHNNILIAAGIVKENKSNKSGWSVDQAKKLALFEEAWALVPWEEPHLTETGKIAANTQAVDRLEELGVLEKDFAMFEYDGERHNLFRTLISRTRAEKFMSTYLQPLLETGLDDQCFCVYYNALVNTGRTSASGPNIQNFPARVKKEEKYQLFNGPMIRGCIVPREGHVFVTADYAALELATLAQAMLNLRLPYSDLADAINEGKDLHLVVGAQGAGYSYEEAYAMYACYKEEDEVRKQGLMAEYGWTDAALKLVAEWRQYSKIANYSFPAGASAYTFQTMARAQGADVSIEMAEKIRDAWFRSFREMKYWFADVASREIFPGSGTYYIPSHGPGGSTEGWFGRMCEGFSTACNFRFQSIAASGAKYAGWLLHEACYIDEKHPLYGVAFPSIFVHDEWGLEVVDTPEAIATAKEWLPRIMIDAMKVFVPDVLIEAGDKDESGVYQGTVFVDRWGK